MWQAATSLTNFQCPMLLPKQNNGYEYLVIGNVDSMQYMEQQLGFGDHEMMIELKR
jgi:hypothetical protein